MSKPVRILWRVFFIGLACLALVILLASWGIFGRMPSISELENPTASLASEVIAVDGTPMGKYYVQDRTNVEFKDISPNVINALIATEDKRFYDHSGIDFYRLMSAVLRMGREGGGSTITQQLAKNLFTENWSTSNFLVRTMQKTKEWIIAVRLERNFTKDEILALYLNTVSFGDNIYGIRNAARTFFQKEPEELNIQESALLIGMLKGNTIYNPRRNPIASFNRRNTVINLMAAAGFIGPSAAEEAKRTPIQLNYNKMDENNGYAPYFRSVIEDQLKEWCKAHKKTNGQPYDLLRDGLKIYTTINIRMQTNAEEAAAQQLSYLQKQYFLAPAVKNGSIWKGHENILEAAMKQSDRWSNLENEGLTEPEIRKSFNQRVPMKVFAWNDKREKDTVMTPMDSIKYHHEIIQCSFMVMDPITGEVRAWVGGAGFKRFKFDHVNINTKRQVGSAFKPILYTYAVEQGYTPETILPDGPISMGGKMIDGKGGPMEICLASSSDPAAVYLMNQFKPQPIIDFAAQCGIESKLPPYPSLALGTGDISMIEMMRAYTMFPGNGINVKPVYISRIEDRNGNILETFPAQRKQVISEAASYTMVKMMEAVVDYGTARRIRSMGLDAEMAGKTGTNGKEGSAYGNTDTWFIGYTPQLLAGAWVGYDDPFQKVVGQGSATALPIWAYFYQKIYADKTLGIDPNAHFVIPQSLKNDAQYEYQNLSGQYGNRSDGENTDNSNGKSSDYDVVPAGSANEHIAPESQLDPDEQKVLREAARQNKPGKDSVQNNQGGKKTLWQRINPFKHKDN
jgi:penicillin-binding protein 1A